MDGRDWSNPRRDYPEYPDGSVVEIRVHGIGGEPPSRMTRDPHPTLVTGDEAVGVFRSRDPVVGAVGVTHGGDARLQVREVVSWGGQTSGTWRHALWVLLLPFALFNVAGRMHVEGRRGAVHRAVCRVLALSMTLTAVALACTLAMDLVAMQCGRVAACLAAETNGAVLIAPFRPFADQPVARLAMAALLPSALLIVMWVASRYRLQDLGQHRDRSSHRTRHTGEPVRLASPTFWDNAWATSRMRALHVTAGSAWITGTLALSLWQVTGLDSAGLAILVALEAVVVLACLGLVALPATQEPSRVTALAVAMEVLRFVALAPLGYLVGAALTQAMGLRHWLLELGGVVAGFGALGRWAWLRLRRGDRESDTQPDVSVMPNLWLVGGALLLGVVLGLDVDVFTTATGMAAVGTAAAGEAATWPGWVVAVGDVLLGDVFVAPYLPMWLLALLQVVMMAVLSAVSWTAAVPVRDDASPLDTGVVLWRNQGPLVVAMISLFVTAAVGAGVHGLVADLLGTRVIGGGATAPATGGTAGGDVVLVVVEWMSWTAKVLLALLAAAAVLGGIALRGRGLGPTRSDVANHLRTLPPLADGMPASEGARARLDRIGALWMNQRLLRDLGRILGACVVVACVALASMVGHALDWPGIGVVIGWDGLGAGFPWHSFSWLDSVSLWVVTLLPLAAFGLVRQSLSHRDTRKQVARLWDVLTFWPRVTHPLAPPCYAETLVPMLATRVEQLATGEIPVDRGDNGRGGGPVIVAGHSQGSVVSMAAVAQLPTDVRERVALVTYGSPIAILYERWFRSTFGSLESAPAAAGARGDDGSRPANLYRHVLARARHWHHVFSMTEPFAFPFWHVDLPETPPGRLTADQRVPSGWGVALAVRPGRAGAPCPVCDRPDGAGVPDHVDLVIADPDVWTLPDGSLVDPGGHGVYRDNHDVDDHLHRIAVDLVERPPSA